MNINDIQVGMGVFVNRPLTSSMLSYGREKPYDANETTLIDRGTKATVVLIEPRFDRLPVKIRVAQPVGFDDEDQWWVSPEWISATHPDAGTLDDQELFKLVNLMASTTILMERVSRQQPEQIVLQGTSLALDLAAVGDLVLPRLAARAGTDPDSSYHEPATPLRRAYEQVRDATATLTEMVYETRPNTPSAWTTAAVELEPARHNLAFGLGVHKEPPREHE